MGTIPKARTVVYAISVRRGQRNRFFVGFNSMSTAKQRKRRVFGKRRIDLCGSTYMVRMEKNRIVGRELWSRREYEMSLHELVDTLIGQRTMRLQK